MSKNVSFSSIITSLNLVLVPRTVSADPSVIVTDYKISPAVLIPGDVGILTITIKNSASTNVEIKEVSLFSSKVDSMSDSYDNVGLLGPSQSMDLSFVFKVPYREGIYFPEIWIEVFNSSRVTYPVPLFVNTRVPTAKEPAIEVEKTATENIFPGDDFEISLKLTNKGESRADEVKIIMDVSTPMSSRSPNNYYIPGLEPGESYDLYFDVTSDEDAEVGLYSIPIALEYSGAAISKEQTESVSIEIIGKANSH
ncbi:MAG: hypothetical protein SVM80_03600 [Halobacteriota archaeon]|nr:hypothetical protein [Halobacteriota archaeon]